MSVESNGVGENPTSEKTKKQRGRIDSPEMRFTGDGIHEKKTYPPTGEGQGVPQVGVYPKETLQGHPEWHRRGVREYNSSWNEFLNQPPFDDLLLDQLHAAHKRGQTHVVVLDLGGCEHRFAKQFLSQSEVGQKSRDYLNQHTDMEVTIVSLTDAQTTDEFLTSEELSPLEDTEPLDNSQIEAIAVPYSVTSQQTLSKFLDHLELPQVDLAVSIGFLPYLQPNVFEDVLTDLRDRLSEDGVAVLGDYQSIVEVSLDDVPSKTRQPIDLGSTDSHRLREEAETLLATEGTSNDEILRMFQKINKSLMFSNVYPFPLFGLPEGYPAEVTQRNLLLFALEQTLPQAERLVYSKEIAAQKMTILDDMQQNDNTAEITYTDKGIVMRKKAV